MYRPGNKWQATTVWGIPEVLEKFDIERVDQVIDFLGMMGDTADNIPGIPGIGKKTAQKFIKEYGSMEGLFANTNQLKGKIKEKVEASEEIGLLCKKLVTIITDVPVEFDQEAMRMVPKNEEKIKQLFEELEFRNLLQRVLAVKFSSKEIIKKEVLTKISSTSSAQIDLFSVAQESTKEELQNLNYSFVKFPHELSLLIDKLRHQKKIGIQIITDNKDALTTKVAGYSISIKDEFSYYIQHSAANINALKPLLENPQVEKIGFDVKFMIKVLNRFNLELKGKIFDVEIAHYLLHPDMRHALDLLAENYLSMQLIQKQSIIGKGKAKIEISSVPSEKIMNYAAQQSNAIFQLAEVLDREMKLVNIKPLFSDIEMPLSLVLAEMESTGIGLDVEMLKKYSKELSTELEQLILKIYELAGVEFNIASPKQMGDILFEKMKLAKKPKKTKSGQYSTSEETLLKLKENHPIIEQILEFRAIKKLLSTYVDALPELVNSSTNRIHTTFNQSVAATGRLSSVNPNLQNIPIRTPRGMKVRKAFVPKNKEYTLLAADYSQIELRIMASLSEDEGMMRAFNQGVDIHSATAAKVYKVPITDVDRTMRSNAKSVNFGIIYGISAFGLSQNIGISRIEAKQIIDQYFEEFPKVKVYMDAAINKAREFEYVETLMGRRRYLADINSRNAVMRAVAERNAINAPIQGSAADIVKKAMIDIQQEMQTREMKSKMLLQVHDELVFDMHNSEQEELKLVVKNKMEQAIELQVPLIVDMGEGLNWLEAH
jgi:DNA polymerase-1